MAKGVACITMVLCLVARDVLITYGGKGAVCLVVVSYLVTDVLLIAHSVKNTVCSRMALRSVTAVMMLARKVTRAIYLSVMTFPIADVTSSGTQAYDLMMQMHEAPSVHYDTCISSLAIVHLLVDWSTMGIEMRACARTVIFNSVRLVAVSHRAVLHAVSHRHCFWHDNHGARQSNPNVGDMAHILRPFPPPRAP